MIRTSLLGTLFGLLLAAAPANAASSAAAMAGFDAAVPVAEVPVVKVAKAGKKKKGDKNADKGKPVDKELERPTEAPRDPRAGEPAPPAAANDSGMTTEVRRGMSRIEFDDRLIQGQTNKANAIYLFERRESALRSLLRKRTHFHEEIDETLE